MAVIALTGYASVGKDEAARGLKAVGYEQIALADPLKELLLKVTYSPTLAASVRSYGWEATKEHLPNARSGLLRLGQACKAVFGDTFWIDHAINRSAPYRNVVFSDIRYLPEYRRLLEVFPDVVIVRILRPDVHPANTDELEVDKIPAKEVLINVGDIDHLHEMIQSVARNATPHEELRLFSEYNS